MDTTLPRPARGGPPQPPPAVSGLSSGPRDRDVAVVETVARWLDHRLIDPIVGLVAPGVGDLLSSATGLVVVGLAIRRRMPAAVIARMLVNLAVDAGLGSIPIVGDLFDVFHRAHTKNARLFTERSEGTRSTAKDWFIVAGAFVLFVLALALPVYVAVRLLQAVL